MLTFWVFTTLFFLVWLKLTKTKFNPIRNIHSLAIPPVMSQIMHICFTYLALLYLSPTMHLTILRLNVFLLPIMFMTYKHPRYIKLLYITLLGLGVLLTLNLVHSIEHIHIGYLFSFLTLISYVIYSITTERALQHGKIDMRYPYYLLEMGFLLGLFGLAILPLQDISLLANREIINIVIYAIFCVCIPYTCYAALLKTTRFKHFTNLSLFEIPLAFGFEFLLLGLGFRPWEYLLITIIIGVLLFKALRPLYWKH